MRASVRAVLEFLDVPATPSWDLTPQEALDFMLAKGLDPSFDYRDLIGAEHARAFTVAKMLDTDLLADVKASLDEALAKGTPFKEWAAGITPLLQAKGWWGTQQVTDPLTGETVKAALGSPARLQTIYRTNMQASYAAGAWDSIQAQKDLAPYLLYDAVDDYRTRPEHHAWDGTVLEVGDDWWATHYPPNGWNCRCSVVQLSAADLVDLGLAPKAPPTEGTVPWTNPRTGKTRQVPKGIDPGWDYNVGAERTKALAKAMADKLAGYAAQGHAFQVAAAQGLEAAVAAGKAVGEVGAHLVSAAKTGRAAAMAAEERAAQVAIAQHLKAGTPHLAKALQAVQASKGGQGLSAVETLAAAEAKAAKAQQSAYLAHWKQAKLAGKVPGPKAQAAFDALPEDAAAALAAQVDQALAAQAVETQAQAEVQAMLGKGAGTLEAKAATEAVAAAGEGAKWADILATAQAAVAVAEAKQLAGPPDGVMLFDDLERIVFRSQAEADRAIRAMQARGYRTWPDGRPLAAVLQGPKP